MKTGIILVLSMLFLVVNGYAQLTEKELKKHRKAIERSAKTGAVVYSFDTIFVKGDHYAVMQKSGKKGFPVYDVYAISGVHVLNIIHSGLKTEVPYKEYIFNDELYEGTGFVKYVAFAGDLGIAKVTAENSLISENGVNKQGAYRFIHKFTDPINGPPPDPKMRKLSIF